MTTATDTPELLDAIEGFLRPLVMDLVPEAERGRGRPRVLPAIALWAGLLVCVARGFSAQLELWRLLSQTGLWDFPRFAVTDDAVYKRLRRTGAATFPTLFAQVTQVVRARLGAAASPLGSLAAWASGVYALDAMTLDVITRRLPSVRAHPPEQRLGGRVATVFDLRAQVWHTVTYRDDAQENEKVAARGLLADLPPGSLLLADLGYFAFAWFDDLTRRGYHWISRLRAKTSYEVVQVLYQSPTVFEALVWLGKHRADRAAYAVRLVRFTRRGRTWAYLTNVLDPQRLTLAEIAHLYARRWDIERMFNLVKTHLHLHLLWSSHSSVILHQVFAVFTLAQIILGLRTEIALRAQAGVDDVSLDLLIRWLPRFARTGHDPVQLIVERGRAAKIIRPPTRRALDLPDPPLADYHTPPDGLCLTRTPRYAAKD
jgi:hypothetical protein